MGTLKVIFSSLVIGFIVTFCTLEDNSGNKAETGISFHQGTWDEAVQLAKEKGKPIFLDISASWCGPCKKLKATTFTDAEVGNLYNANFINVLVDGEKGEGIELARKYKISGFPSLIFIDSGGQLIAQTAGYRTPEQFIEIGEQVLSR